MNTELLLKVRAQILKEPERFSMDFFKLEIPCGTLHCIGGWALALSGFTIPSVDPTHAARAVLNLQYKQGAKLFFDCNWPTKLRREYFRAACNGDRPAMATAAASRIDHFIKTGGRE